MSADLIGGIVIGVFSILAVIVFKNWFWELYSEVCDLRQERKQLQTKIRDIRMDVVRTQEDINDFYQWRKERGKE